MSRFRAGVVRCFFCFKHITIRPAVLEYYTWELGNQKDFLLNVCRFRLSESTACQKY